MHQNYKQDKTASKSIIHKDTFPVIHYSCMRWVMYYQKFKRSDHIINNYYFQKPPLLNNADLIYEFSCSLSNCFSYIYLYVPWVNWICLVCAYVNEHLLLSTNISTCIWQIGTSNMHILYNINCKKKGGGLKIF